MEPFTLETHVAAHFSGTFAAFSHQKTEFGRSDVVNIDAPRVRIFCRCTCTASVKELQPHVEPHVTSHVASLKALLCVAMQCARNIVE